MSEYIVAIVYHSQYGHTKVLADAVLSGVNEVAGTKGVLVSVDDVDNHWDTLDKSSAMIFGAPTYMGSVSAGFWTFAEKTSKKWHKQEWKDKLAGAFINSGSQNGDKLHTLYCMFNLAQQHGMIWVGLGMLPGNNSSKGSVDDLNRLGAFGGAFAQSNTDQGPDVTPPQSDRKTAAALGKRIAEATLRWEKGKTI